MQCLLCASKQHKFFFKDKTRNYRKCLVCSLIFVPAEFHISRESEKARYEQHNNTSNDIGYRQFLERITTPIKEHFKLGANGLDFGCGPMPLLAEILKENGYRMEVYDSFYADDESVFEKKYDFIVSTEVFEHLRKPLEEFKKLFSIIKENGMLAIMTLPHNNSIDFKTWHYKNDRTHICFYSIETFNWLAKHLGLEYSQIENDIFVFRLKEKKRLLNMKGK